MGGPRLTLCVVPRWEWLLQALQRIASVRCRTVGGCKGEARPQSIIGKLGRGMALWAWAIRTGGKRVSANHGSRKLGSG
jgi:hypothetical protein